MKILERLSARFRARDIDTNAAYWRAKIGRNALCPCGSGKKYKKCCGAREDDEEPPGTRPLQCCSVSHLHTLRQDGRGKGERGKEGKGGGAGMGGGMGGGVGLGLDTDDAS